MEHDVFAPVYGCIMQVASSSGASLSLNAAATWGALGFTAPASGALSKVRVNATLTSTPSSWSCDLYSDNGAGLPNASLESVSMAPVSGVNEFTGFTYNLVAGTKYHLVFKNLDASPTTKYPSLAWMGTGSAPFLFTPNGQATGSLHGFTRVGTLNSGGTWATSPQSGIGGWELEYSDGRVLGILASSATSNDVTYGIYSAREAGNRFLYQGEMPFPCGGIVASTRLQGTPTVGLLGKLYKGTTLVATSPVLPVGLFATTVTNSFFPFAVPVLVEPGDDIRLTCAEPSNSDASTSRYNVDRLTIPDLAKTRANLPVPGTQHTYYNAGWTEVSTLVAKMAMVRANPYTHASLLRGPLVRGL